MFVLFPQALESLMAVHNAKEFTKIILDESEMPTQWYNIIPDLPTAPPPPLHPATHKPIGPQDLAALFPKDLIEQVHLFSPLPCRLSLGQGENISFGSIFPQPRLNTSRFCTSIFLKAENIVQKQLPWKMFYDMKSGMFDVIN